MKQQTTVTADGGAGIPRQGGCDSEKSAVAGRESEFHEANRQLREQFLLCNARLQKARESGDLAAAAEARRERDRVGEKFLNSNMRLGFKGASKFARPGDSDAGDYEQAAMLGLWEAFVGTDSDKVDDVVVDDAGAVSAASGWDPDRGAFSSLAHSHIRGRVQRAARRLETRNSGMSYAAWTARPRVLAAQERLRDELGHEPSASEIAARADVSTSVVRVCLTATPLRLDQQLDTGGDGTSGPLSDFVPDESFSPDTSEEAAGLVSRALQSGVITARQAAVLVLRYGMHGLPARKVAEVASLLNIGRGTVSVEETRAVRALQSA